MGELISEQVVWWMGEKGVIEISRVVIATSWTKLLTDVVLKLQDFSGYFACSHDVGCPILTKPVP